LQVEIRIAAFNLHVANVFPSNRGIFNVFHLRKSVPEAAREGKGFFRLFFGLASFVPRNPSHSKQFIVATSTPGKLAILSDNCADWRFRLQPCD
jgi:hypothetical protein